MSADTATEILDAARSIFEAEGVEAVTMRRVAERVGITAMAIYRHFPSRNALIARIADGGFADLAAQWQARPRSGTWRERLLALFDAYLDYALKQPRMFDLMFAQPRTDARRYPQDFRAGRSPTANLLADAIEEGMQAGALRRDDLWEVAMSVTALAHGLITLKSGGRFALSQKAFRVLYRQSLERLLHGLER
jgi:AcrR family transcriptional regulator